MAALLKYPQKPTPNHNRDLATLVLLLTIYIDNKDLSKTAKHGNLNGTLGEHGNLKNHKGSQIPIKPRDTTKRKSEEPEKFEL